MHIPTVAWEGDLPGTLVALDQTRLPRDAVALRLRTVEEVYDAILRLVIRGAPAIGVGGGYGVVIGLQGLATRTPGADAIRELVSETDRVAAYLKSSRPTAVNLSWAVDRVADVVRTRAAKGATVREAVAAGLEAARALEADDRDRCARMGEHGAALLKDGDVVYTHCNAGALATAGIGTALGVVYTAHKQGKRVSVFADETRPLLQGARLTAWELQREGVPVTVVSDGMAASVMRSQRVSAVVVGADRIARNGDTANKIGTCSLAIVAKHFGVPFWVVAPLSTFDRGIADGSGIPIEMRSSEELTEMAGVRVAPEGVGAFNPAFDVTPAALIAGIVTEVGIASPPTPETVDALFRKGEGA